ncbi:MAG: bifunctional riboflavin kinase/FAD synthetase [Desulfocapsaceae bacterium]|nr:bifunctional riboflavin kinase/FAD synthetase [Desulfocapsaceae bacterium]
MKIIRNLDHIKSKYINPCVTIGNFDGVHLGHQRLFEVVEQRAYHTRGTSIAVTFDPHPLQILKPGGIKLISTIEQKIELIELSGIDILVIIPFDRQFAATSAESFVDEILIGRIGVRDLFVGYDYAFGKGRAGNIDFLKKQGQEKGFSVTVIDAYYKNDVIVSSTKVRELVAEGRMVETSELLGRYYQIRGVVQRGKQRGGKEIGYPTANLHISEEDLVPRRGVYVCQVVSDNVCYGGVINIGYNPTFGEQTLVAETHIFDFNRDIYGKPIKVNLIKFLRSEEKYANIDELSSQISRDVNLAKQILAETAVQGHRLVW